MLPCDMLQSLTLLIAHFCTASEFDIYIGDNQPLAACLYCSKILQSANKHEVQPAKCHQTSIKPRPAPLSGETSQRMWTAGFTVFCTHRRLSACA